MDTGNISLPDWVLDATREANSISFGRVPVELVVARGQVTKVVGTRNKSVKVKNADEAFLYAFDYARSILRKEKDLPPTDPKNGGTITFSLTHKNGEISLVNTFDTIEYNYPM